MNKAQKLWQTCLGSDDKIDELAKAMREQRVKRREAYDDLKEIYQGKTKEELAVIWDENFKEMTELYYQDESVFPDAFEKRSVSGVWWNVRTTSKRQHFICRMLGLKRRESSSDDYLNFRHDKLISTLEALSHELIIRHKELSPAQMRNALKCYENVLNVFHKYHKDEIKGGAE